MANTIGFGQAAVNNTIDYGQGATDNTINWGKSQTLSPSGETNITGTGATPSFSNVNSFSFDGVDDYFMGTSTYSELDGETKMTFSCWIKPTSASTNIIASIKDSGSTEQFRVLFHSSRYINIRTHTGNGRDTRTANSSITLNVWTHISFCLDFSLSLGSRGKIFINGVDATSADSMNQTSINTSGGGLRIGARDVSSLLPFTGLIEEVAIWSGTDQRANVSEIYGGGQAVDLNNLATAPQPTTWQRMGDNATWNGASWTMTDVNGGYTNRSINMIEANRTTDVPPNPFVNTQSILLDGVDDYVDIGNLSAISNTSTFSVSTWFKTNNVSSQTFLWSQGSGSSQLFAPSISAKDLIVFSGSSSIYVRKNNIFNSTDWFNLVVVYNGSLTNAERIKLYLNGSLLVASVSGTIPTTTPTFTTNAKIGGITYLTNYTFNGTVDETSFFNNALSQTEVNTIYGSGVPSDVSTISGITNWYRCGDGDTAPTLTDNIGSNDGTMTNFTTFSTDIPT